MIKPVAMYQLVCDRCGTTFSDIERGIDSYAYVGDALESSLYYGWKGIDGRSLCPHCYRYDEDKDDYVELE